MSKKLLIILSLFTISLPSFAAEKLHLVTSLDPLEAAEYIKEFEGDTGITVEWIRLSAGEVTARLQAEGTRQTQSVWFGGPSSEHVAAKRTGLLDPYKPKGIENIPEKWSDPEGYYTGIYFGSIVFVTNKNYLAENNLAPPSSWNDLLNEEWKGRITTAYPYTAGTGYTILTGLISLKGEDDAYFFWKKLDPSIHHYTKSGSTPIIEVGLGEASVGIVFAQDAVRKGIHRGFPLTISYPEEGSPFEIGGVALLKNAPEPELGKKFIDWITSLRAQDLFQKWGRTPVHPDAAFAPDVKRPDEINLIDMNMIKMGEMRPQYVDRWRKELRQ